uniref:Acyl-CoA-binding domain-containing protein 5 n=1 Tax=Oncorhynchus tshawytscha TaxID=74940 RepID=A0A8C8FLK6_ONCTS
MGGDGKPLYERRFDAAVKVIQSLPPDGSFQPSNDMMLKFYSHYKQSTLGPCNTPRPGFWDPMGKVKWDAWNDLGEMPKEEAMIAYVDELKLILEGMPCTTEVEQLLLVLGPFYEQVQEKKHINQVSDLSAGFGTMITSAPSKSVTRSIIRTMEMNGTLETRPPRPAGEPPKPKVMAVKEQGEEEEEFEFDEEDEVEEEEIAEIKEVKKANEKSKKKGSSRRPKVPLSEGNVRNGMRHFSNGTHTSKAALNCEDSEEGLLNSTLPLEPHVQVNGHHADKASTHTVHATFQILMYVCLVQGSEAHTDRCLELDEEEQGESHSPLSDQEGPCGTPEDSQGPPKGIQCGGEDGETSGGASQRQIQNTDRVDNSLVRRERGKVFRAWRGGSGPLQGSGGDGERWGGAGATGGSLNEQIVVALARLQEDMQSVLERLQTLEALTASQSLALPYPPSPLKPSWWPFDVSPSAVAFAVAWPFVVQWLIRLYLQRKKR